nr:immunoglobulin heavy chain junction region [Macaca mulatta]MOW45710.1 immunoglobulin heavy chain junction region [Macaca mulatta]MOW46004.1 immunoglobulin heavy chain junction region [Macaca mulatta]MOW46847.1 immunoglobulin heavy chain junction region [Macaca mulatta]MOW46884.1 immunoglobulin heavy chain junction region [Macaca mulatta]
CAKNGGTGVTIMDVQSQTPFDYW